MRRDTSTQWYIGAWVVWVVALVCFSIAFRHSDVVSQPWFQNPNLTAVATIAQMAMLVMFVAWIGALVRLAKLRQWNWFAALFLTQMFFAGIAGMVCYAGLGPEDEEAPTSRPQVT